MNPNGINDIKVYCSICRIIFYELPKTFNKIQTHKDVWYTSIPFLIVNKFILNAHKINSRPSEAAKM